ncbi:MAG: hypothetical protein COX70_05490 [Flavobacteriales bacterium CG_4_10_14_0_2_um_filter_32_8]|nr:MAG: hypothetical protein COX70_05490 [Flavobacteriales bacterium CG_4_10_14_0_2_um_filter_32_8]PJB14076.1 MAG: hypothetical protein CO118_10460 [Flavobacteriales bacterium CG_4_9_14_3_um_filter_32_8]
MIGIFLFLSFSAHAQTSNKKRILVVPYGRFDFVSEFSLEDIAEKNETTADNVFLLYQKALLTAFEKYVDENFEFVAVSPDAINPYIKFIKYKPGKFDRKNYNSANLKDFKVEDFTQFLEHQNTDFVIFITWYDIQKESFIRGGKLDKRVDYAAHYLDFDIYNLFEERIVGMGKVKAEANVPSDLEASYHLLRLRELESGYQNFISKVIEQLNKPVEN